VIEGSHTAINALAVSGKAEASFSFGRRTIAKSTILLWTYWLSWLAGTSKLGLIVAWTLLLVSTGEQMEKLWHKHVFDVHRLTMHWRAFGEHTDGPMDETIPSSFGRRIFTQLARFAGDSIDVVRHWGTS
jgi:hypothetical protein